MYTTGRNCVILLLLAPGGQTRAKRLRQMGTAVFMYQSVMQAFLLLSGDSGLMTGHTAADLLRLNLKGVL